MKIWRAKHYKLSTWGTEEEGSVVSYFTHEKLLKDEDDLFGFVDSTYRTCRCIWCEIPSESVSNPLSPLEGSRRALWFSDSHVLPMELTMCGESTQMSFLCFLLLDLDSAMVHFLVVLQSFLIHVILKNVFPVLLVKVSRNIGPNYLIWLFAMFTIIWKLQTKNKYVNNKTMDTGQWHSKRLLSIWAWFCLCDFRLCNGLSIIHKYWK